MSETAQSEASQGESPRYEITCRSAAETQAVGARLARLLHGGEVIELISDLGGGKTTFVQGMTAALGYTGEVTSPTFALSNVYRLPKGFDLHHYDLYRLSHGGVVGEDMAEDMGAPTVVIVIEWAGAVQQGLPVDRLRVTLEHMGGDERRLAFEPGGPESARLARGLVESAAPETPGADAPTATEAAR